MGTKESKEFCKGEIENYQKEIKKLEREKKKYLKINKKTPKRINKRIKECCIIIDYYECLLIKIQECENKMLTPPNTILAPAISYYGYQNIL